MKLIRNYKENLVILERLTISGAPQIFTARAYEKQENMADHQNRVMTPNGFYGDICYRKDGKEKEDFKEVYRLVDIAFPELVNRGLKQDGYVKFSHEDIKKSLISFENQ